MTDIQSNASAKKDFSAASPKNLVVKFTNDGSKELKIENLRLTLPDSNTELLHDVNLTLKPGDRLILTGPSGCGKSSLVKAIAGLWDSGSGLITMPEDSSVVCISQKAYMPDTTLPGILSYPLPADTFTKERLEEVLNEVKLPQLIQYLPGRQLRKVVDDMLATDLPHALKGFEAGSSFDKTVSAKLVADLKEPIAALVKKHIELSQDVAEGQKKFLAEKLKERLSLSFTNVTDDGIKALTDALCTEIANQTMMPMIEQLSRDMKDTARVNIRTSGPMSESQARRFGASFERTFLKGWAVHFKEKLSITRVTLNALASVLPKNIGDAIASPSPEMHNLYIPNAAQKEFVGNELRRRMESAMIAESAGKKRLSTLFNMAAFPLTEPRLRHLGRNSGKHMFIKAATQLLKERATGDSLSKRLSGGEQQRIGFARLLLHKPQIALLDEVTSALDQPAGAQLYKEIVTKLPDTLIISVAHNTHIREFHTLHARMENKGLVIEPVLPGEKAKPAAGPTGPVTPQA